MSARRPLISNGAGGGGGDQLSEARIEYRSGIIILAILMAVSATVFGIVISRGFADKDASIVALNTTNTQLQTQVCTRKL
jgi:hypothetical protein